MFENGQLVLNCNKCIDSKLLVKWICNIFSTNEYNSFVDLVNNTKFESDYLDSIDYGYQVVLFH